ncbi:MAG: AmmeMemoRadiSam system protein A [Magnetovibrio sp.]|nr:AmmeMemoRadiSam system protein A [Magnetovibrio sp.]
MSHEQQESAFAIQTRALLAEHGDVFLQIAKSSIENGFQDQKPLNLALETLPPEMTEQGACFVTLHKDGKLRGCIGSPEARLPLAKDVAENAYRSAFRDPRFGPVKEEETDRMDIHLSVLSPAEPFSFTDEEDLITKLRVNTDGLIIEDKGRRALFLPSVWQQLPDPKQFVAHLKAKAGLGADHWSDTFKGWRFIAAETGADWNDIETSPPH